MKYPILLASDLHLSAAPYSEYRWKLFGQLADLKRKHNVKTLAILGDLTDAKDGHSAALVNRIVGALQGLPFEDVFILSGNHDWLKEGEEFFRFLNYFPTIQFITKPTVIESDGSKSARCLMLPYSKTPLQDWSALPRNHWDADYVMMHQTIKGAVASNGQVMEGEALLDLNSVLGDDTKVYSGDIHVPQVIGRIEYVGSPYHVHLGDNFTPRVVLIDKDRHATDIHCPNIRRVTMSVQSYRELERELARRNLRRGDHVKVRMILPESDKHHWFKIKREAATILKESGVEVYGIEMLIQKSKHRVRLGDSVASTRTPVMSLEDHLAAFVVSESLGGDALEAGLEIIESKP